MKRLSLVVLLVMMAVALAVSGCGGNGNGTHMAMDGDNGNGNGNGNGGGNGVDLFGAYNQHFDALADKHKLLADNQPAGGGDLAVTQSSTPNQAVTAGTHADGLFFLIAEDDSWSVGTTDSNVTVTERDTFSLEFGSQTREGSFAGFRQNSDEGVRYFEMNRLSLSGTDYLALGRWAFVPEDTTNTDLFEIGTFADGTNPVEMAAIAPVMGTATYRGLGSGLATAPGISDLSGEATDIQMNVELTADFGDATGLGTIGGTFDNFSTEDDGVREPVPGSLTLAPSAITATQGGVFQGTVSGTLLGESVQGHGGGQFYGSSAGQPEAVAGTFGVGNDNLSVDAFFVGLQQ